ncbi:MAG: DUF5665 domain-containing protein [Alphaproteobacteria bacterium]|nr:DUF5665 domain-containing protein [Alphaproteobacteria bacterium]
MSKKAKPPKDDAPAKKRRAEPPIPNFMDISGVNDYVRLTKKPAKLFWLNFYAGVARGLGFTVGTAVVLAIVYKILSHLISMNIPYLTEMLRNFIEMIQNGAGGFDK